MLRILLFIFSASIFTFSFGQNVIMGGGTTTACTGTLLDPGGTGNYANSSNVTWTLCPSTTGTSLQIDFTAFDVENNWDFLTVYDGTSTAAPVIGTYSGTGVAASPGSLTATNPSGCLTFVFTSDGSVTRSGWTANISCSFPCQQIVPSVTSSPAFSSGTYIDVCQGQSFTLFGNATFPQNNTNYFQSVGNSTFNWTTSEGGSFTGQNFTHSISTPGIYSVDLEVVDVNGCTSTQDIDVLVRVSPTPIFAGTSVTNSSICLGETNTLSGTVAPQTIELECTPPVAGLTALPDGSGISYTSSVPVDCFGPSQTITSASDLQEVCITMEHSYLGDLQIQLICPDGVTSVILHAYPGGGGTYLGNPIDQAPEAPGTGWQYCFDMTSPTLLVNGPTTPSGTPAGNAIQAGSYLSAGNFAGLVGCPINGNWSISITDNLGSDDGYIFGWNLSFDPSIIPPVEQDVVSITSESWQSDPTITATSGSDITVTPTVAGTPCYTYEATDEYGCTYDTTVCFTVVGGGDPSFTTSNFCEGATATTPTITGTTGGTFAFNPVPTDGATINSTTGVISNGVGGTTYTVEYTTSGTCPQSSTQSVTVYALPNVVANDVSVCTGGTVSITATGASTYSWDNGLGAGQTHSVSPASNTTYTVTGTDGNGCVSTDNMTVTIHPTPVISAGADQTICLGSSATLSATGGATYSWDNGLGAGQTHSVSPTATTTYTVTGTDANGCSGTDNVTITVQSAPVISAGADQTICLGGSATLLATGGATYSWDNGLGAGQTHSVSPATTTTYTVTGTDANGCTGTDNVVVTITPLDNPSFTTSNFCEGTAGTTPTITGTTGGTFAFNPVPTDGAIINSTTGVISNGVGGTTYTIEYTTNGTCPQSSTQSVTVYALPNVVANDVSVCPGGTVSITATGASTYSWDNGLGAGQTHSVSPASNTTYTVTGTDGNGCVSTDNMTVTVHPTPVISAGADQTICLGSSATLLATGGATYSWDNGLGAGANHSVSPTTTTTYTVTGTDANGCTGTDNVVVTITSLDNPSFTTSNFCEGTAGTTPTITGTTGGAFAFNPVPTDGATINSTTGVISNGVGGTTYTIEYTTNGTCPQSSTQSVTVYALPNVVANDVSVCVGGTVPITATGASTYSWDNGLGAGQTHNVSPASNTTYTVTGTDANGCVSTDNMTVSVLTNAPINAGADQTICLGSSATLFATGGATYSWDNGLGAGQTHSVSPTTTTTYTVTGTDANGCTGTDAVTVTVLPLPTATLNGTATVCQNGTSPTITFTGSSGTAPYTFTYTINGGASQTIVSTGSTATLSAPTTTSGTFTYELTNVEDASSLSCSQSVSETAVITVNALPVIVANDVSVCPGGTVSITATGASMYSWDNGLGAGQTHNVSPASNTTYTVTGTDVNGCVSTDNMTVSIYPTPVISAGADQTICLGSSATLFATGGATYSWDNGLGAGQTHSVSPATTTTYTVTGTDANGCTGTDAVTVTVLPLPTATLSGTATVCQNETSPTITFTGSSGTAPYTFTYTINGGASQTIVSTGSTATLSAPTTTSGTFTYELTNVEDASSLSCSQSVSETVVITVNALPVIVANDVSVCPGGTVSITATGASTYSWDNGLGAGQTHNVSPASNTTYTVTGTDVNGCVSTDNMTVSIYPTPVINAGADQTICLGGSATLLATGGATYSWDNGLGAGQTHSVSPATTTTYTVTGTDANGCSRTDAVTVTVLPLPTATLNGTATVCQNGTSPTITFTGSSGTAPYTFTYTINGGASQTIVSTGSTATLSAPTTTSGTFTYELTNVEDASSLSCSQSVSETVVITVNALPFADAVGGAVLCQNDAEPTVVFTGSGGVAPYTFSYNINNGGTQTVISSGNQASILIPTNVADTIVVVLEGVSESSTTSCAQALSDTVLFVVNPLPNVDAGADQIVCEYDSIALTATGATTYSWDNGVIDGVLFEPVDGVYTVTGTDTNGCVNSDSVELTIEILPVVSFTADSLAGCAPFNVTFENTTNDVTNCVWEFENGDVITGCGQVSTVFDQEGEFDVTLTTTSANGCSNSETYFDYIVVEVPPIVSFSVSQSEISELDPTIAFQNNCSGATSFVWDFGDGAAQSNEENPEHTFPEEAPESYDIELFGYTDLGCVSSVSQTVSIVEELIYYVPNTFTPDGNNFNGTFTPVFTSGFDPQDYELLIFNRWGELIFESNDATIGWPGTYNGVDAPVGMYVWKIRFSTGTTIDNKREIVGHVNLLR